MDIDYLLALQDLRVTLGDGVEMFFATYSELCMYAGLVACAIVYWCVHKRTGQFSLLCFAFGNWFNQLLKNIACVYRPWILDSRITPAEDALGGATGYSFPSGHTVTAGAALGSLAWCARKKLPVVSVILLVALLLLAFSRNYLGVHTPQDVLVALAEIVIIVLVGSYVYSRYEARCEQTGVNHDGAVVIVVLLLCVACLAIIELKPYPMDYSNGVLLVDPEVMKRDCFEGVGVFAGMFVGWYCERRWVRFRTDGDIALGERIARGVLGLVVVAAVFYGFDLVAKAVLDPSWAKLTSCLVLTFVAMFVVPLLFAPLHRVFEKRN